MPTSTERLCCHRWCVECIPSCNKRVHNWCVDHLVLAEERSLACAGKPMAKGSRSIGTGATCM
jgi:hypothetical protein